MRVLQDPDPLPEVVQDKCGQGEGEPPKPDGTGPEVAAIGIQRLGTGDGEDDTAEYEVALGAVIGHEPHRPARG